MKKKRADTKTYVFPLPGKHLAIPIVSLDGNNNFTVNIYRAIIKRQKIQTAELYERNIPLLRMCFGGKPHSNPEEDAPMERFRRFEGADLGENHLHYYVEKWGTVWGVPLVIHFDDSYPLSKLANYFMEICNVIEKPVVTGGL